MKILKTSLIAILGIGICFIFGFSCIAAPLTKLTKKDTLFH